MIALLVWIGIVRVRNGNVRWPMSIDRADLWWLYFTHLGDRNWGSGCFCPTGLPRPPSSQLRQRSPSVPWEAPSGRVWPWLGHWTDAPGSKPARGEMRRHHGGAL